MDQQHIKLVNRARAGDMTSFSDLYNLYCDKVYTLVRSMIKNEKDAEDVVQETFIGAWRRIHALAAPEAFDVWIQRIARNRCCTYQQKMYKKILAEVTLETEENQDLLSELEAEDESIPSIYVERDDLKQRLNEMISRLSDTIKQTFILFYLNNMKVEEIAQIMECGVNTVRSRLRLGRKSIRLAIEEWEAEAGEEFYYGASVPMIPLEAAIAQAMKRDVLAGAASETILNNVMNEISQIPAGEALEPKTNGCSAPKQARRIPGLIPQTKVIVLLLTVIVGGAVVYGIADRNRTRNVPAAAVAPLETQAPGQDAPSPKDEALASAPSAGENEPAQTSASQSAAPSESADGFILWTDPALEAAVRASMRIPEAPIAVSAAANEKRLQLNLPKAASLVDLQYFPNLESLELEGAGTLDLSPLVGLAKLEELHITGMQASDWASLAEVPALRWLSLDSAKLSDPAWLAKLTRLELLHLSNTNAFDLTLLHGLTALGSLQITDCNLADLTPLSRMTSLVWISVKNTNVSDLSPLSGLPALEWLDISGTKVKDISPIANGSNPPHVVADGF